MALSGQAVAGQRKEFHLQRVSLSVERRESGRARRILGCVSVFFFLAVCYTGTALLAEEERGGHYLGLESLWIVRPLE